MITIHVPSIPGHNFLAILTKSDVAQKVILLGFSIWMRSIQNDEACLRRNWRMHKFIIFMEMEIFWQGNFQTEVFKEKVIAFSFHFTGWDVLANMERFHFTGWIIFNKYEAFPLYGMGCFSKYEAFPLYGMGCFSKYEAFPLYGMKFLNLSLVKLHGSFIRNMFKLTCKPASTFFVSKSQHNST